VDAVIKVGGSLAANAVNLRALCAELGKTGERLRLVVVPGGGEFADVVRTMDSRFVLDSRVAHRMAVLGMDQYGLLLSTMIPECRTALSLTTVPGLSGSGHVVVLLPSRLVLRARSLDASWEVTSDSIAAYVAGRLGTAKLVLVTNVDGVFTSDPRIEANATLLKEISASGMIEMNSRTSVDKSLPHMLLKCGLECFVVNGFFPERVAKVLVGEETICTHISAR
jgi:aspartokinase-like uncharacterized kinase